MESIYEVGTLTLEKVQNSLRDKLVVVVSIDCATEEVLVKFMTPGGHAGISQIALSKDEPEMLAGMISLAYEKIEDVVSVWNDAQRQRQEACDIAEDNIIDIIKFNAKPGGRRDEG